MSLRHLVRRLRFVAPLAIALGAACDSSVSSPALRAPDVAPKLGKTSSSGTTSTSLSSVSPDSAPISTTLDVQVNGSALQAGMVAIWQLNGVADSTQIRTNSMTFVSSKQMIANITISGTATAASWDVALYSGTKTGVGSELSVLKKAFKVTDPTATFFLPLNDAGLALKSDYRYSDGTSSVYDNGVCKVSAKIFATTQYSSSGDVTLNTNTLSGKCVRHFTLAYPDGYTETVGSFINLRQIENPTYSIPIGTTAERQLHVNPGVLSNNPNRCDNIAWGYDVANNNAQGSDSVLVTRVDASTWHVFSQPAPHTLAWCKANGLLYSMPVDFIITSSRPLP